MSVGRRVAGRVSVLRVIREGQDDLDKAVPLVGGLVPVGRVSGVLPARPGAGDVLHHRSGGKVSGKKSGHNS